MLLQVVSDTWDVGSNFDKVAQTYTSEFTEGLRLGFLGVIVPTRVATPRFCGEETFCLNFFYDCCNQRSKLVILDFSTFDLRGLRTNWLIVGIYILLCFFIFGDDTLGDSYHLCVLLQHLSARPCTLLRDQK